MFRVLILSFLAVLGAKAATWTAAQVASAITTVLFILSVIAYGILGL